MILLVARHSQSATDGNTTATDLSSTRSSTSPPNLRVAVIGAGPSGTAVLRSFASLREKGQAIPTIVCFEKQADVGGLWNYNWRVGVDEHGRGSGSTTGGSG